MKKDKPKARKKTIAIKDLKKIKGGTEPTHGCGKYQYPDKPNKIEQVEWT